MAAGCLVAVSITGVAASEGSSAAADLTSPNTAATSVSDMATPDTPQPTDTPGVMDRFAAQDFAAEAGAVPDALAEALRRDLDLSVTEYLAEAAAAADAVDVVAALTADGVDVAGARLDGTALVVDVASAADRAAVESAGAVVGESTDLDLTGVVFTPALDVDGGEGYVWSTSSGGASQCSLGFTGRRISDGRAVAATAGHCVEGMSTISGGIRQFVQSAPGSSGTFGSVIGSPGSGAFGGGMDGGLVTLDGPSVQARSSVLTWGGGAGAPRSSATLPVLRQSAAIVGASLCKSGSRTGWTCGTVRAVDTTVRVGSVDVNSIIATTCIQPGDSGGAALIGQSAVGINSSTSSAACGASDYVSAFFPMISAAGKGSMASRFGSVWEPSFAVTAPTIDLLQTPSDTSAGILGGSVDSPSTASTVRVYVDGASTPVATVAATSGRWSLDLQTLLSAGVGSGGHTISVAAFVGTWSGSARTDTTVEFGGSPPRLSAALLPAVAVTR
ncbi:MAG: hypothetical protein RI885_177 [Actinomycetota bacterium]